MDKAPLDKATLLLQLHSYADTEVSAFVLKNPMKLSPDWLTWAANQLHFMQKLKHKVPSWAAISPLEAPPLLSIEQASSEATARWKSEYMAAKTVADLTGGMGVDSYFFSLQAHEVHYVEQQPMIASVAAQNFAVLNATNIRVHQTSAEAFLAQSIQQPFDAIYLDPARRDAQKNKVVQLADCEPNVVALLPMLWQCTSQILIKLSPLLSIQPALQSLQQVAEVVAVSVKNEVKELLFLLRQDASTTRFRAVELASDSPQELTFSLADEQQAVVNFSFPQTYLYEPAATLLKLGAFKWVAAHYQLNKIAPNSHLYTNNELLDDFMGRKFKVEEVMPFDKKALQKRIGHAGVSIACRNFPLKPDEIRQQCKLKDGQTHYLFFTETSERKKIVIITTKVL